MRQMTEDHKENRGLFAKPRVLVQSFYSQKPRIFTKLG